MILELNTCICSIVDVGLYQSRLCPEFMFDSVEHVLTCSEAIGDEDKVYFFDKISFCFNTAKYKDLVARYAATKVEDYENERNQQCRFPK